jgi:radical SAM protein with 4Fe4S-binding SPASM domain
MFYKQKSNVIFRNYESFGYITDNRNFGYKLTNSNENFIGDRIFSESGAIFLSVLNRKPQELDELVNKISKHYIGVNKRTILNDVRELYNTLEQEGFIVSGKTYKECDEKDTRFSYRALEPKIAKNSLSPTIPQPETSTQDFFKEYFKGKPLLTNLHIEITSRCNERCIHCYIPNDKKVSHMEPTLFHNVLRQCIEMKLLHLTLSGGEPMLHKNFTDFLRKCREYNFSINVLSNLTLLNEEIIEEMKMNPLLGVQVSVYSMDPDIHDKITQIKGSFEKTQKAILKLIENDIPLQISCPIMKQNKDYYYDVVKWAKRYNINVGDDYCIIARFNHTTENLCSRLSINEIKEVIYNKFTNDSKYLEHIRSEAEKKKNISSDDFVCSVCQSSICIAENGNVYPCAGWQGYVVGNVKEASLNKIWNKSEKVYYLRNLRKQDFPRCIHCLDKEFCTMCMVRNANENLMGDPLIVNEFFCNVAKLNRQIALK